MSTIQNKFGGLLQHPYEPLFIPKNNGQLMYELPEKFFTDRYRPIGQNIINRFSVAAAAAASAAAAAGTVAAAPGTSADTPAPSVISFNDIDEPDLAFTNVVPRRGGFSVFFESHRRAATGLIEMFMNAPSAEGLADLAAYVRDRVNGPMFQYALSTALLHREDTSDVSVPSFFQLFPDQFVDPAVFPQMLEEGRAVLDANRMAIDIPMNYTASELVPEQRMAYFREDIGVNLHHWHWHLVYPGDGPETIVRKNRRGELFYYMHQQLLARHQIERFANGLGRVEPLNSLRAPVNEPYYPKIIRSANNRTYPARYRDMVMEDVDRPDDQLVVRIADVEQQLQRIVAAIDAGVVVTATGKRTPLDNFRGIDILGDIIESSAISVNRNLYGDTHNSGHILLSFIHDPRGEYLESFGVMGDVTTAMRDPIFYRWHTYVDNLFQRHKMRFAPYTAADLRNPGVNIVSFNTELERQASVKNLLLTFWQRSQVDLGAGLDFGPEGNAFVTFTHLQHAAYNYRFQITVSGAARNGTIRIFLAPRKDERGRTLTFEDQRRYAIEMDTFRVNLKSGVNNLIRRSVNSSVTIPYERTFRDVTQSNLGVGGFRFCGCGWPSHMLVPKGDFIGVDYDLFAMVSNFDQDRVDPIFDEKVGCNDAHSFCGLRDRTYPDARNMGFPLDRRVPNTIRSFADFTAPYQNMKVTKVTVRFTNTVVART